MKAKMLMAPSKRRPILKHYQNAVEITIWFNKTEDAKVFTAAAVKKFATPGTKFHCRIIEFKYSELSRQVRLTFGDMTKEERTYFRTWLTGYAYAKKWSLPLYNLIDQPIIDLQ